MDNHSKAMLLFSISSFNTQPAWLRLTHICFLGLLLLLAPLSLAKSHSSHGLAMHGELKYQQNFKHFDYVNPDAPKGGDIVLSALGGFNSLNPFVSKGVPADHLALIYDTLTEQSADEPFSEYGLVAKSIELDNKRRWVIFHLNPQARFQDGTAITAADVVFSFETLVNEGRPHYKAYYQGVKSVEALDPHRVRFNFNNGSNSELPLILGQLPVLPKHYWEKRKFNDNLLDLPLGSGPYKIVDVQPGQSITYQRDKHYWAAEHPVNKGRYNFDKIRIEYFLDINAALEGFKAGRFDFYQENSSKRWATQYQSKRFDQGELIKAEIKHQNPSGMQAFVFNLRKSFFKDRRVRQALNLAFDFEWTNKNLFYGAYRRTDSYFENSELAASGLPSKAELKLLDDYRQELPADLFTRPFTLNRTQGNGNIRKELRQAMGLLKQAGWEIKNKRLINTTTGKPFEFEILLHSKDFERIVLPMAKNLQKLGITAKPRLVDQSQYIERVRNYEFDMIIGTFPQSNSPGNEQRDYWYSAFANKKGSRNLIGVQNPVVDHLIEKVIAAKNREALITATRALDRVLLWNYYVIPQFHIDSWRVAYKSRLQRPAVTPKYDLGFFSWWMQSN